MSCNVFYAMVARYCKEKEANTRGIAKSILHFQSTDVNLYSSDVNLYSTDANLDCDGG